MMMNLAMLVSMVGGLSLAQATDGLRSSPSAGLAMVPFQQVHVADDFWGPRLKVNQRATIEANLHQCEITGRIKNFAIAGKLVAGKHEGALFNDSDVYKMIEGIAYALSTERDADLERRTDAIIDQIAAAQQPDGYLNTYYTLVEPQNRWKNIRHGHELYCSGHLMEAAVAYYQATGKRKLLDVACRLADHIASVFGPGKRIETSGHEEIELALVKLYRATHQQRYLDLARFFLDVRGRAEQRGLFGEYHQDHKPVREQNEVTGHAVRAMYLYSAMADVAALTGDAGLIRAMEAIWHDVVDRKMYLTGGIGPSAANEGFTVPYDLPNESAYAETCAAIGMALWNHRLFLMSGDGKYADVLEREVYNGLLSGVSLSGDRFFYVNPLASAGRHHRVPWFDCSCCPTNIVRYLPAMGERVYATRDNSIWTVLYLGNSATVSLQGGKVKLTQTTRYPWEGDVRLVLEPERPFTFDLHLRIPGWCRQAPTVTVNGRTVPDMRVNKGYLSLSRTWQAGDVVQLSLPMAVERIHADPRVKADVGRVALMRGPVVYCLEGADNAGRVRQYCLPREANGTQPLTAHFEKDLLGGVVVIRGQALEVTRDEEDRLQTKPVVFQAIPYSTWDNRSPGEMIVWLAEQPEYALPPSEQGIQSNGVLVTSSHLNPTDSLASLNDDVTPKASGDHSIPRMTWWDHRGSVEWIGYRLPKFQTLSRAEVYWFDDTGRGACRVPAAWKLLYRDGREWKPVKLLEKETYGIALDRANSIRFEPIETREVRLEVQLRADFSGGVLKFHVAEK